MEKANANASASSSSSSSSSSSLHDECKNVISFHNHFTKFLRKLKESYPEIRSMIAETAKEYVSGKRSDYIECVRKQLEPYIKYISAYDYSIFSDDFCKGKMELVGKIDFKRLWKLVDDEVDSKLREDASRQIFDYLQTIYICACMASAQIDKFNEELKKQKDMLMSMLNNINIDKKLREDIDKISSAYEGEGEGGSDEIEKLMQQLSSVLGDNIILDLAKQITNELNEESNGTGGIAGAGGGIAGLMSKLASGGVDGLREIFGNITEKVKNKIQSGEFSQQKLQEAAMQLKERIEGVVPGLSDLTSQINTQLINQYNELSEEEKLARPGLHEALNRKENERTDEDKELIGRFTQEVSMKLMGDNLSGIMAGLGKTAEAGASGSTDAGASGSTDVGASGSTDAGASGSTGAGAGATESKS